MKTMRGVVILAIIVVATAVSFAHDTWLVADRALARPGATIELDLTSGMAFPSLDHAIEPDRVDKAFCRLAGRTFMIKDRSATEKSLRLNAHLVDGGVATLWVELKPRSIELTPDQVQGYLEEIGASEEIRSVWANSTDPKRWREVYSKHSKTFVRVGEAETDRSWAEAVGGGLEIVPETDPTTLRVGDELSVRLLRRGTAAPNIQIGIIREGEPESEVRLTDPDGQAAFVLARPGRWLLRATDLRPSAKQEVDWESDFATLTIEVLSGPGED